MAKKTYQPIKILSLDGSDIYRAMNRVSGKRGISIKDKNGQLDTTKFRGFLDISLDTEKIKSIYSNYKELPGHFNVCDGYTASVISVSFEFAVKQYFNKGKQLFVKDGYDVTWEDLEDHVCIIEVDGEKTLIAIEVAKDSKNGDKKYTPVEKPISEDLLGDYFYYDSEKKFYFVKTKSKSVDKKKKETTIKVEKDKKFVREWLYEHGFDVDGVHYVRYKRSAGSSREGNCLFIAEPLYKEMMAWSSCGLDESNITDQASWQAYISLTLSSIEKKIHIPRQSILLIEDQESVFTDKVIRVKECGDGLSASLEEVEISNVVWDGEALLDSSVFADYGYSRKGMMLLRNRFFKTCAFNTNLQKWFADNNITELSQLNGCYSKSAESIKDIKLVITESSLKYLKFKPKGVTLEEWFEKRLDNVFGGNEEEECFGVVKTDKPSGPMGNYMVKTNYQLLNTLELTQSDVTTLLKPSHDFWRNMQDDPMYLRYHVNLFVADPYDIEDDDVTAENYRQRLISDIMRRTDDFEGTLFYRNYRTDICKKFKERLKHGRILVNGGYHTLLGNGLEFLHAIIDKDYKVDEPLALGDGEIFTQKFPNGKVLLCERSPHITMGNLLMAQNKYVPEIEKYFNLGEAGAIVCVNAIKSNIQQRLNGCDYDSDSMLITEQYTLRRVAIENYNKFPVPYCDVQPGDKMTYDMSAKDLAKLDVRISENKIGEIVNLSQFLNSLYWDRLANGESHENLLGLYCDICKLAVLSGMEIDKAKRLYKVSAADVLNELRKYKDDYKDEHGEKIPEFFAFMTNNEDSKKTSKSLTMNTAMSFIYSEVDSYRDRASKIKAISYSDLFELQYEKGDPNGTFGKRRDKVLEFIKEKQNRIRLLNFTSKKENRSEKLLALEEIESLFEECQPIIQENAGDDDHLYYLLLKELDKGSKSKKGISAFGALLFASMCYANDGYLMRKLKKPEKEMHDLIHLEDAPQRRDEFPVIHDVFGHPHVEGFYLSNRIRVTRNYINKNNK